MTCLTASTSTSGKTPAPKLVAITGATGYVGSRIARTLEARGWRVVRLSRTAADAADVIPFRLGDDVDPRAFVGFTALVHCAYDFGAVSPGDIHAVNVTGTQRLLRAARKGGIDRMVFVSSISAFPGCRSLYGRAKLQAEEDARAAGAWAIRPGLVWGDDPGGLFGRLMRTVRAAPPVLPYPAGGRLVQYLVHDADLSDAVCRCLERTAAASAAPITVAHPQPWLLRDLLAEIGRAQSRQPAFVPIPWQLAWLPLRIADSLGLPLRFHSDNLISFVHQNQNPAFNAMETLGVQCRAFSLQP